MTKKLVYAENEDVPVIIIKDSGGVGWFWHQLEGKWKRCDLHIPAIEDNVRLSCEAVLRAKAGRITRRQLLSLRGRLNAIDLQTAYRFNSYQDSTRCTTPRHGKALLHGQKFLPSEILTNIRFMMLA
jgi:hypothetical protein